MIIDYKLFCENLDKLDFDDWEDEDEYYDTEWEQTRNEFVWTTADKRKILLKDITDNHLYNLIKYVKKHIESYGSKHGYNLMRIFKKELDYRK